jgi:cholesterol oxidase
MKNEHFDAVIVGSGFGGSVTAYRLAHAGLRVAVLERGKPYPPNSFPRTPIGVRRNFWDPSNGLYGLFNIWSFKGSGAVVSSGLGGGSLIYANVILRKDEKWFVKEDLDKGGYEYWPVTRQQLDKHYDLVDKMLNVQKYPFGAQPYDRTLKALALREAAASEGLEWIPLNLAVSFRSHPVADPDREDALDNPPVVGEPICEARPNYHRKTRYTCRLCGECDAGCNYGSKNTLDYTYLTEAQYAGAEIRTLCEVRAFEPRPGGGFRVDYLQHDLQREGTKLDPSQLPTTTVTCDRLILAAGALGTPFLLFKNRAALPHLSDTLGTRFGVNGDLLSFLLKSRTRRGEQLVPRELAPSFGPVITSAIRLGDTLDGLGDQGRGFYVEDGGYPAEAGWGAELTSFVQILRRAFKFGKRFFLYRVGLNRDADLGDEIADLIGDCVTSSTSMPVLMMGRDHPTGRLRYDGRYLDCDWSREQSRAYYDRVVQVAGRLAKALNATYRDNPSYQYLHQVLSAHPLGGCPMGVSPQYGVTNPCGEVFGYPGLHIADGSVMPGPVGANPSMTIAALADRFADHIIAVHNGGKHACDE